MNNRFYDKNPTHTHTHTEWINASNERERKKRNENKSKLIQSQVLLYSFLQHSLIFLIFAFRFSFDAIWTMQFLFRRNEIRKCFIASIRLSCKKKNCTRYDNIATNVLDVRVCVLETLSNYKWTNVVTKLWFTSIHMSVQFASVQTNSRHWWSTSIYERMYCCISMCDDKQHESK